jgi:GDPmannose 4,6-dehydratase
LVTGITGQDGSFLAELLLEKGYDVVGVVRGGAGHSLGLAEHLRGRLTLVTADLLEPASLRAAVAQAAPQELYHLAAPSFVPASWERPAETMVAIAGGTGALLEAVREVDPGMRVYSAASGAMFGDAPESPQREETPCHPKTPYAVAKLAAHQLVGVVRVHDHLHASSGITFNHESERRPERFVTRKVTRAAAAVKLGLEREVVLGDLDAVRDWSFAGDVVYGAWLMLQQEQPDDYILASGVPRTVADLARTAFACVDLEAERYVRVDDSLVRRAEATPNVGSPAKARAKLGWEPRLSFEALVERMVRADLQTLQATR